MKQAIIIIVVLIVLGYFGYRYGKKVVDKIEIRNPKFDSVDWKSIINGGGFANINLIDMVINRNNFTIPVSGLYVELSYKGNLIGKSTTPQDFIIPANGDLAIKQNMTVAIGNSLDVGLKKIQGEQVTFDIIATMTLFGFYPYTYIDTITF